MSPDATFPRSRLRIGVQLGYLLLFSGFVLWPNVRVAPSIVLIVAAVLAGLWLVGILGAAAGVPRFDELTLCGCAAPILVGLTQLSYRVSFVVDHGGLTRPSAESDSAQAFLLIWGLELLLILLPGILFLVWNAKALAPVPEDSQRSLPSSRSKRT